MNGKCPSEFSIEKHLSNEYDENKLVMDLPPESTRKRKMEHSTNGLENPSHPKKQKLTVAYKRGIWRNEIHFPALHKYRDIRSLFLLAQTTYLKSQFPIIYILHFEELLDVKDLEELKREMKDCGSFDIININFDEHGNVINSRNTNSKARIPIYFVEYPDIITDIHIMNLKLAGFYNRIHVCILLNVNNYSNYCQFGLHLPSHTHILHNGIELKQSDLFLQKNDTDSIKRISSGLKDTVPDLLEQQAKQIDQLHEKFDNLLKLIEDGSNNIKVKKRLDIPSVDKSV